MPVTPEELAATYPLLYHMADAASWPSIQKHGLLSTSSLLDLFGIRGKERRDIESTRRPISVEITSAKYGRAVVRDQKPLSESKLEKSLTGCSVQAWYRLLNKHVFFWLTKTRLQTLISARAYRDTPHLILTIDTLSLVNCYRERIVLSPMNSGNTQPFAHPRSPGIFMRMSDYPFKERAKYGGHFQVVELAVEGGANLEGAVRSADIVKCHGAGMRTLERILQK